MRIGVMVAVVLQPQSVELTLEPTLSALNIFFALLVAIVPLFYPGYYSKQVERGIETLKNSPISVVPLGSGDTIQYTSLTKNDPGFKQISKVIEKEGGKYNRWFSGISGKIDEIRYYRGSTQNLSSYFGDSSMEHGLSTNFLLSVRYANGDEDVVFYNQWQPKTGMNHADLRSRVSTLSERHSRIATSGLAVLWTAVAVANLALS